MSLPNWREMDLSPETQSLFEATEAAQRTATRAALEAVIAGLDYDLHKSLECDEETGEDRYPEAVEQFMGVFNDTYRSQPLFDEARRRLEISEEDPKH